ncbi:MAG: hypothetical protein QM726_15090 [Chitinophagaceae bacterium]
MNLKKVPVISKQELFLYAAEKEKPVELKIVTRAGFAYYGIVVNISNTRDEGQAIIFQLLDERYGTSNGTLQIALSSIESVEIARTEDALVYFSQGKIGASNQYQVSGKLDTQRALKKIADSINAQTGLSMLMPEIELPRDGQALNRIIKLSQTIEQVIAAVLKESDALSSWKEKYNKLVFSNSEWLELKDESPVLHIYFAFNNIDAPEISIQELQKKLLGIL